MQAARERMLVTGAAGVVASVLIPAWRSRYDIVGIDRVPVPEALGCAQRLQFDLHDADRLVEAARGCSCVVHLATGASDGWAGLQAVDVGASRTILQWASRQQGVRRVVLASSNHAAGGIERDWLRQPESAASARVGDSPRPDSEYGAAKAAMECYARYAAECLGVNVSCLRIGTVRRNDDWREHAGAPEFAYLGTAERIAERLRSTWLTHADLVGIADEELRATGAFRLRFAFSLPSGGFWPKEVLSWDRS